MSLGRLRNCTRAVLMSVALAHPAFAESVGGKPESPQISATDLSWAEAGFETNSASRAQWASMVSRAHRVTGDMPSKIVAEVTAAGGLSGKPEVGCYWDLSCQLVLDFDKIRQRYSSLEEFRKALKSALPIVGFYRLAVDAAKASLPRASSYADELQNIAYIDQLRRRIYISAGFISLPDTDAKTRDIFLILIKYDTAKADLASADWLDHVIDNGGWASAKQVGEAAADDEWLIAEHSDRHPALQAKVLSILEREPDKTPAETRNYAYLYDRLHIALGKPQRFGTQLHCVNGAMELFPLEQPDQIDAIRAKVGLGTIADYKTLVGRGDCQPST